MSSELTRIVERFVEQALAGAEELARPATLGCVNSGIPHPQRDRTPSRSINLMPPVYEMLHALNQA